MTERCSTSTLLILSGGSSSTTGQRDAASLSSRFWFGVKIPSTFILVSTDFELSAISKIVKVFLTGTSLQPSWRPRQTKQALVDWANIFGDNNVEQMFLVTTMLSKYFWWQQCWLSSIKFGANANVHKFSSTTAIICFSFNIFQVVVYVLLGGLLISSFL